MTWQKKTLNSYGFFCTSYGWEPPTLWIDEYEDGPLVTHLEVYEDGTVSDMKINEIISRKLYNF